MPQVKRQYYIRGVDNQKRSDLTFDFKRVPITQLQTLSDEDKLKVVAFLEECQVDIEQVITRLKP